MVVVSVVGDDLVVRLTGWDAIWSFKRRITVPLAHVTGVRVDATLRPEGRRHLGTYVPKLIAAGTFGSKRRGLAFWCVRRTREPLVIDLEDERFNRLVLQVPDPRSVAMAIANHQ